MKNKGTLSAPGLDKVIIKPTVGSFDYYKLKENEDVQLKVEGATVPILDNKTGEYVDVNRIYIRDNVAFKSLTVGTKRINGRPQQHCYLDLTRVGLDDNNLIPLGIEKFKEHADKCIEYIEGRYNVVLDKNRYKGECMEINTNIRLDRSFKEYKYILELMHDLRKRGFKGQKHEDEEKEFTGIKLFNDSMSIKIYNKSTQLATQKNIPIYDEVMRVEVAFLTQNKINDMFGTCYIDEITDEQMKKVLLMIVEKELFKPLEKHIDKTNKELRRMLKEEKKENVKSYKRSFLSRSINKAFDIQQPLDLLKLEAPKHFKRDIKKLQTIIEDDGRHLYDNLLKFTEIKTKLFI